MAKAMHTQPIRYGMHVTIRVSFLPRMSTMRPAVRAPNGVEMTPRLADKSTEKTVTGQGIRFE